MDVLVKSLDLLLILTQMRKAIESAASDGRPAAFLIAGGVFVEHTKLFLLSEVKSFTRVDLESDRLHKISVRDAPITILIEVLENAFSHRVFKREAPVL